MLTNNGYEYYITGEMVKDKIREIAMDFPNENESRLLAEVFDICLNDLIFRETSLDTLTFFLSMATALKILNNNVIERNYPTEGLPNPEEDIDNFDIAKIEGEKQW